MEVERPRPGFVGDEARCIESRAEPPLGASRVRSEGATFFAPPASKRVYCSVQMNGYDQTSERSEEGPRVAQAKESTPAGTEA